MAEKKEINPNGIQEWIPKEHGLPVDVMPSFRFTVYMQGIQMGFSKISNIETFVETEPLVEGGVNDHPHSLRKPVSREKTLILERGMATSSVGNKFQSKITKLKVGQRLPLDLIITVNRRDGKVQKMYKVQGATVKSWKCSELNAMSGQPLIETFELIYEKLSVSKASMIAKMFDFGEI